MSGCGLIAMFGPLGWRKSVHVWLAGSATCCCGLKRRATEETSE